MRLASFELHSLSDGLFGLDGGAMFGVVPRVMWQEKSPPDRNNRIRLALRPLLIVTPKERILVDTGVGRKYGPKFEAMFNVDNSDNLPASLERAGFGPEHISTVVQTHLHFDHCGWATRLDEAGRSVPTFPNARFVVQAAEWHDATHPNRRTQGSYRPDDFLPLEAAGLLELVDGDTELTPGVRLVRTGGHTRGHQIVIVEGDSEVRNQRPEIENPKSRTENPSAVYWGDLIPTTSHIDLPYIMGYDLYPLETMAVKEKLEKQAAREQWLCFFEHDPIHACGHIRADGNRLAFKPEGSERNADDDS